MPPRGPSVFHLGSVCGLLLMQRVTGQAIYWPRVKKETIHVVLQTLSTLKKERPSTGLALGPCPSLSPVTQDHKLTIFCFLPALPTACTTQIPARELGFPPGYMQPPIQEHSWFVHEPPAPALGPSSHPLRVCRADALEPVLTLQLLLLKSLPSGSRELPRHCSFDFLFHYCL